MRPPNSTAVTLPSEKSRVRAEKGSSICLFKAIHLVWAMYYAENYKE
jgi:hypothetical protein